MERDHANSVDAGSSVAAPVEFSSNFHRQRRLTEAGAFDRVFRKSRRSADGFFTVLYRPNDLGYPRVGLAIAKKRVRQAVTRNRLKRIIRESFRTTRLPLNGLDIVVLARDQAGAAANPDLFVSLTRHWNALGKSRGQS
jgi:ribonuclease P protein component